MRGLFIVALALITGCRGTALTQVETGYQLSPVNGGLEHGGMLTGHAGGSDMPYLGIGVSARARIMSNAWAFPEFGPHAFFLLEDDAPVAFYVRINPWVGLGSYQGDIRPMFTGGITPGLLLYPGDSPLALSLSLTAEYTMGPALDDGATFYDRAWFGVQFGFAIGGVKD